MKCRLAEAEEERGRDIAYLGDKIYNGRLLPEWQPRRLGTTAPFTIEVDVK